MKEFKVSNDDLVIFVKPVHDELNDTERVLLIVHHYGSPEFVDEYRLVSSISFMNIILSYLQ